MKRIGILVAVALLASLGTACSSDDKKSSGSGQAACESYCSKLQSVCGGDAGLGDTLKIELCDLSCVALTGATGACDASGKAYYDCLIKQSNVCADGCKTEEAQYTKDCKIEGTDAG